MTYAPVKFEVIHPFVKEEMHLQENTFFDLDIWGKVTGNVAQYSLHHVTYEPVKFEVIHPSVKEEMHLQENTLFDLYPRSSSHKMLLSSLYIM